MGEKLVVVKDEKVSYDGPMNVKNTVKQLKDWMEQKGYGWTENEHVESVNADGKYIELSVTGEKKITDYAKKELKLKIKFENIKDKVIDKQRVQLGKVSIGMDGALLTDYEERWKEDKPAFYLLRTFFEKYIYSPYSDALKKEIREDVDGLKESISAYLNLFKYAPL